MRTYPSVLEQFKQIHGNRYNYDDSSYVNMRTKMLIECSKHGKFLQRPHDHVNGRGCHKCFLVRNKDSHEEFICKCVKVHESLYDYSLVNYINQNTKISIICRTHGEFFQFPTNHLKGHGCPRCAYKTNMDDIKLSFDDWVVRATETHKSKYTYEKFEVKSGKDYVNITCPKHGVFKQRWVNHVDLKQGCRHCFTGGRYTKQYFEKYPEKQDIPSILYLLKFSHDEEIFYKIGITSKSIAHRWGREKYYAIDIIKEFFGNLIDVFNIEQTILNDIIYRNRHVPIKRIAGDKECFTPAILDKVIQSIETLSSEMLKSL